jgi:hypothetical protein
MCDQNIDPTPFIGDPHHQRLDRLVVPDIHLDPEASIYAPPAGPQFAHMSGIVRTSRCREADAS